MRLDGSGWPAVVATVLTLIDLGGLSFMWVDFHPARHDAVVREPSRERIVYVAASSAPLVEPRSLRALVGPDRHAVTHEADAPPQAPPDSAASTIVAAASTPPAAATSRPLEMVPLPSSARLAPPRAPATPWYVPSRARSPFVPALPPSIAERDSTLAALGTAVPELAARRVPTRSERDARAKEAMLKMRLSGRILLVPPDNSGGLITLSIPLPIFSRGPSRAKRRRDSIAVAADQVIRDRLRLRADSLRQWRVDSAAGRLASPE